MAALHDGVMPDVVLADYNLPNFSGPEALQLLKKSGLDIPFIMMSGAVSEETAVDSMRAGAHDYVAKQNLTRLVPALERELKEASGRRNKLAAEAALLASEARFHRLVEAMPLGLLISEARGRIVYANSAVERLLGCSDDDIASGALTLDTLCPSLTVARERSEPRGRLGRTVRGRLHNDERRDDHGADRNRASESRGKQRRSRSWLLLSPICRCKKRAKRFFAAPKSWPSRDGLPPRSRMRSTTLWKQ